MAENKKQTGHTLAQAAERSKLFELLERKLPIQWLDSKHEMYQIELSGRDLTRINELIHKAEEK